MFTFEGKEYSEFCEYDSEEYHDALLCDQKEIVKISLALEGYYDIKFEDGTKFYAVSEIHIKSYISDKY
tara:strand:- start:118 stop:324 length:207 start_codon:yes stop_codon:yes gene_type:complete